MRPELETYHLIDRYLNQEMDSNELLDFEKKIQSDQEFAEEFALQKNVNDVIKGANYDKLRAQIKSDISRIDNRASIIRRASVLAGFTLLIGSVSVYFFNQKSENESSKTVSVATQPIQKAENRQIKSEATNELPKASVAATNLVEKQNSTAKIKQYETKKLATTENIVAESKTNTQTTSANIAKSEHAVLEVNSKSHEELALPVKPILSDPCADIRINAHPSVFATCAGESNGKILYDETEIKGGNGPYHISINRKDSKHKEAYYSLNAGEHTFYIRDAKGCSQSISVIVPEKTCRENKFTIYPDHGEMWKIAADADKNYALTIHNRSGKLVFKRNFTGEQSSEWNGADTYGVNLEAGMYIYLIEYSDGKKDNGQITIIR